MFDTIIIGAGFAGSVLARKLSEEKGRRVLIIEKRRHIAGNCFDYRNPDGILVHKYGPHLFHTSNRDLFSYLEQYTTWREYHHRVLGSIDGKKIPLPFNLTSLEKTFPPEVSASLQRKLVDRFGFGVKVPILELRKSDDSELKLLAAYVYEKVFLHYTEKQWDVRPEEISPEVTGRVPVHISYDDRYFQDSYQAVPQDGYTALFSNLLDHPDIHTLLNTDYKALLTFNWDSGRIEFLGAPFTGDLIFTGMIDDLFGYKYGALPYRMVDFAFQRVQQRSFQDVATENYPNDYAFTRITEFKYIHPKESSNTVILREYPRRYRGTEAESDSPCYPVFNEENQKKYEQYLQDAQKHSQITLLGRLAEYRYYDMDDIVEHALNLYADKFK